MEEQEPSYTPASFEKRVAAWIGIGYMLMLIALITYTIATARTLPGTAPLLVVPVGIGVPFIAVHRQRQGTAPGGLVGTILICLVCLVAVVLCSQRVDADQSTCIGTTVCVCCCPVQH